MTDPGIFNIFDPQPSSLSLIRVKPLGLDYHEPTLRELMQPAPLDRSLCGGAMFDRRIHRQLEDMRRAPKQGAKGPRAGGKKAPPAVAAAGGVKKAPPAPAATSSRQASQENQQNQSQHQQGQQQSGTSSPARAATPPPPPPGASSHAEDSPKAGGGAASATTDAAEATAAALTPSASLGATTSGGGGGALSLLSRSLKSTQAAAAKKKQEEEEAALLEDYGGRRDMDAMQHPVPTAMLPYHGKIPSEPALFLAEVHGFAVQAEREANEFEQRGRDAVARREPVTSPVKVYDEWLRSATPRRRRNKQQRGTTAEVAAGGGGRRNANKSPFNRNNNNNNSNDESDMAAASQNFSSGSLHLSVSFTSGGAAAAGGGGGAGGSSCLSPRPPAGAGGKKPGGKSSATRRRESRVGSFRRPTVNTALSPQKPTLTQAQQLQQKLAYTVRGAARSGASASGGASLVWSSSSDDDVDNDNNNNETNDEFGDEEFTLPGAGFVEDRASKILRSTRDPDLKPGLVLAWSQMPPWVKPVEDRDRDTALALKLAEERKKKRKKKAGAKTARFAAPTHSVARRGSAVLPGGGSLTARTSPENQSDNNFDSSAGVAYDEDGNPIEANDGLSLVQKQMNFKNQLRVEDKAELKRIQTELRRQQRLNEMVLARLPPEERAARIANREQLEPFRQASDRDLPFPEQAARDRCAAANLRLPHIVKEALKDIQRVQAKWSPERPTWEFAFGGDGKKAMSREEREQEEKRRRMSPAARAAAGAAAGGGATGDAAPPSSLLIQAIPRGAAMSVLGKGSPVRVGVGGMSPANSPRPVYPKATSDAKLQQVRDKVSEKEREYVAKMAALEARLAARQQKAGQRQRMFG